LIEILKMNELCPFDPVRLSFVRHWIYLAAMNVVDCWGCPLCEVMEADLLPLNSLQGDTDKG
jgi:hypothetical protein